VSHFTARCGTAAILSALLLVAPLTSTANAQSAQSETPSTQSPAYGSPGYEVDTRQVDTSWMPAVDIVDGKLELTMWEAIEVALRRNYSLVIERYNLEESSLRLTENRGIFDLLVLADLNGFNETSPAASNLDGALIQESEGTNFDVGLDQLNVLGGIMGLSFDNSRNESNSQFAAVNPSYRVDLDATYSQPLLRNFGKLATKRSLIVATNNLGASQEDFEVQVIEVVRTVGQFYWLLVEAREQLGVAAESLRLAEELHEQNKIRVEVGTLAPLELIQSEAGMATRRDEYIRAQIDVGNAEDDLRQALNVPEGELWDVEIVPLTPPDITRIEIDPAQAVAKAVEERAEIRRKRILNKNLEVEYQYRRNQHRPQLDLRAAYGFNGLGGPVTLRDFITGEIIAMAPGDYSDALDQIADGDFDGWSYGLFFSLPVQNRERKAQLAIAEIGVERGDAELKQLELQISTEVRKAARAVTTAEALVDSTRVSRRLEEENLKAEQKRYENGMSTSYRVLEIQEDLATARSNAVRAETGYRRALIDYLRSIGTLDDEVGIVIDTTVQDQEKEKEGESES
jgi:outer membrane protein TolC